jgi:hypothetical protein
MRALLPLLMLSACATPAGAQTAMVVGSRGEAILSLGAQAAIGPVSIEPLRIVQDSRCAVGAQCVWAGTVKVAAAVGTPRDEAERELELGVPAEVMKGQWVTLVAVCPIPKLGNPIPASAYRLTFRFERTRPQAVADASC